MRANYVGGGFEKFITFPLPLSFPSPPPHTHPALESYFSCCCYYGYDDDCCYFYPPSARSPAHLPTHGIFDHALNTRAYRLPPPNKTLSLSLPFKPRVCASASVNRLFIVLEIAGVIKLFRGFRNNTHNFNDTFMPKIFRGLFSQY